ncbi:MAG: toll/interleukin-1 receptor domain-containing protein [Hyphomicrobium sp.]|nr:toll/interleukin-1 receptor domain-containing protein [Hyphomicrobium sp.]
MTACIYVSYLDSYVDARVPYDTSTLSRLANGLANAGFALRSADDLSDIDARMPGASLVLVLIGPPFAEHAKLARDRKLDVGSGRFFLVTRELQLARAAGLMVVPLLIDGAKMPARTDLPDEIAWLADIDAKVAGSEDVADARWLQKLVLAPKLKGLTSFTEGARATDSARLGTAGLREVVVAGGLTEQDGDDLSSATAAIVSRGWNPGLDSRAATQLLQDAVRIRGAALSGSLTDTDLRIKDFEHALTGGRVFDAPKRAASPQARNPVAVERAQVPYPRRKTSLDSPALGMRVGGGEGGTVGFLLGFLGLVALGGWLFGTSSGASVLKNVLDALGLKLGAFPMFGMAGARGVTSRRPDPAPPSRPEPRPSGPVSDTVNCSIFAPMVAPPDTTVLVQVFLHVPAHAVRAAAAATLMDAGTKSRGVRTLDTEIRRGSRVTIALSCKGVTIEEPSQTVIWRGAPTFAQFLVTLPNAAPATPLFATARIAIDGELVGRITFTIGVEAGVAMPKTVAIGTHAKGYTRAFVSYAAEDRKRVLERVQMLRATKTEFFQDILSLDPGARWRDEIFRKIDQCDLFLLFWSAAARNSNWVIKEAERAIALQAAQQGQEPDIAVIVLDGPPPILPPDSLASLHFNDPINYVIASS